MRTLLPVLCISLTLIANTADANTLNNTDAGIDQAKSHGLNPKVANLAMHAYTRAMIEGDVKSHVVTIIDYSLPSDQKRMWVVDLNKHKLTHYTYVAHGKSTGERYAAAFSNKNGSHQTSLGVFTTQQTYNGKKGYSLRLNGLEKGFNDKALQRSIVIHGAAYADPKVVKTQGRLGRSWGCPSVPNTEVKSLINDIKNGSLVFAYYPNSSWLKHSKFLA